MTLSEYVQAHNIKGVFHYAGREEQIFNAQAEEIGYTRQTTFFHDLSIGEWCGGVNGVKDTYKRVVKSWLDNVKYFTEFVMSLNWKSWEWSGRENDEYTALYVELYEKAYQLGLDTYKDDELNYFLQTLD